MSILADAAVTTAISQLGVREIPKGSNAGPEVEIYLKSIGLGKGYAWCMAFVYWVVSQAALKTAIKNPLLKTGGVLAQYRACLSLVVKTPQPGDVFIMDFGRGTGHTGFVEKVVGTKIYTIEGNTNDNGSREGDAVCRRKREISSIKAFIRI